VDKKLSGWSHSKCCGQWLDVQVETSDECCPRVSVLGPVLLKIFCQQCGQSSKFASDTKLCGAVNMLEGRDAI